MQVMTNTENKKDIKNFYEIFHKKKSLNFQ